MAVVQDYAESAGPACPSTLQHLLDAAAATGALKQSLDGCTLAGVTPLHLLCLWTLDNQSSSSRTPLKGPALAAKCLEALVQHTTALGLLLGLKGPDSAYILDVDAETKYHGDTPLCFAAAAGSLVVAKELLRNGADVNRPRRLDAARPIDLAVSGGHADVACLLLTHGAEVSQQQQQQ